ncbi:MAG: SDR family oxidoreductase [Alphaproteobacteria bacterium]|jgi:NAD(P)-dependent dehydrogenase (short-subunit alcohol dehydrogenase family)|nr:SDR family oxidoreductase [Alphaproteobacteria bacterium]
MNDPFPPQKQSQPGREHLMTPPPEVIRADYRGTGKLDGKVAVITGGDSGIGRSAAVHFAREGARVVIAYLEEQRDAEETREMVEAEGRDCALFAGDLGDPGCAAGLAEAAIEAFGTIDILVNNAAEQHFVDSLEEVTPEHWERTFRTNIHACFYLTRAALPHLGQGASIINTTSVNAYKGNPSLIAYSSTKGAIVSFTRSIATSLAPRGIRVNGVAPGPVWTPLIPATADESGIPSFGESTPLGRAGQPSDCGPAYVFLASEDGRYITGQVIHPNGGYIVNG